MDVFVPDKEREGFEVFHTFLESNADKISNGENILLEVTDLDTVSKLTVKAIVKVRTEDEDSEAWKDLWIRDEHDKILPDRWKVKILEELDPDEVEVHRPGFETEGTKGPYGSPLTTKKMEQDALTFKKQFGKKKSRDEA